MTATAPERLELPVPGNAPPRGRMGQWMFSGGRIDEREEADHTAPWWRVMCLTGMDYFSSIGYEPGMALLAAGALALPATAVLVALTVFGAVPLYSQVAKRSYAGQGSIAMLEHLLPGWASKIFVLVLLGFAGTDFLITMTLSAADAARHAVANAYLERYLGGSHMLVTLVLLLLLAVVFLIGFREAIRVAVLVAIPYLALNFIVLAAAAMDVLRHPALTHQWRLALATHGNWGQIAVASVLIFPELALGMSGFETGVSVMPLIHGSKEDSDPNRVGPPLGRIGSTRKLLLAAALIMAGLLLASGWVCPLLIPPAAYQIGGPANGRAVSYLAVRLLGANFATLYDLASIAILWFGGASAMAGLLSLIPRYLPRFGMAPRWVAYRRPMVLVLLVLDVLITLIFKASVDAQGAAYATGFLVLMFSAGVAVALALHKEAAAAVKRGWALKARAQSGYFWAITLVLGYTLAVNIHDRPDGVIIAVCLIILLLGLSAISRYRRATEMRISELVFLDADSRAIWAEITGKKVNVVPSRSAGVEHRHHLASKVQAHFQLDGPLAFLHVQLLDNRSEFLAPLRVRLRREGPNYTIEGYGAVAIANSIAYITELLDPISLVLGLTHRNLMRQSLQYLIWGQGEVGLTVYSILVRYWEWARRAARPIIFLMCD
ncbi:MAG: hypothetical protein ACRD2E_03785 [Terriglobales bacterium]